MTLTVGVEVVEAATMEADIIEVIDDKTDGSGEYIVVVSVLTQG